jgi:hypothetical protein
MATRTITTRLAVEGETEFKRSLSEANSNLKVMRSEMGLVDAEFKGQANSMDALTAKNKILRREQEQQAEKVKALERAVKDAADAYGENDKRTDNYRQQLNRAKKELIDMNDALDENEKYLDEARKSADKCASSIDGFGREVKDAGNDLGDGGGLLSQLGDLKGFLAGGAIVAGAKAVGDAIIGIVDDTEEYRKIMGTLEISSQQAGYTADETAEAYKRLHGVLGDTQTAATTLANLQAIGLSQSDLITLVDAATGAWATYGDSIPIDGLSEAINETIQTGKVTGTFADVLNWAGESEDDFNEKLAAANSTTERAQIVLDQLSSQNLPDAGQAWRDANGDLIDYNESQQNVDDAMAKLGERLAPVAAGIKNTFAGAVNIAIDTVEGWIEALQGAVTWLGNVANKIPVIKEIRDRAAAAKAAYDANPSRNSRSAGYARLHESRAADGKSGQSTSQTINVKSTVVLDGKEVGRSVTKYQMQAKRAFQ